jgi:hypothetical protein
MRWVMVKHLSNPTPASERGVDGHALPTDPAPRAEVRAVTGYKRRSAGGWLASTRWSFSDTGGDLGGNSPGW